MSRHNNNNVTCPPAPPPLEERHGTRPHFPVTCALCGRQESAEDINVLGEMLGPFYDESGSNGNNNTNTVASGIAMSRSFLPPHLRRNQRQSHRPPLPPPRTPHNDNNNTQPNATSSHRNSNNMLYVHRLCALWSPEVYVSNETGKYRNVLAAVR